MQIILISGFARKETLVLQFMEVMKRANRDWSASNDINGIAMSVYVQGRDEKKLCCYERNERSNHCVKDAFTNNTMHNCLQTINDKSPD